MVDEVEPVYVPALKWRQGEKMNIGKATKRQTEKLTAKLIQTRDRVTDPTLKAEIQSDIDLFIIGNRKLKQRIMEDSK